MLRKSYDTRLKYLAREGLLPETYRKNIHRSLICKWKQEPVEKYTGYELNSNIEELYELMKVVSEDQRLQKAVKGIYRIQKTLKDIIGTGSDYIRKLKEHKTEVVNSIQRAGTTISIAKACKLVGIGRSTFRNWAKETYFKCSHSILKLCSNNYPSQLTFQEVKKMYNNFSRFILSWRIADKLCAKMRLETFREAVINSKIRRERRRYTRKTQLIVDGGKENNNHAVDTFIQRKDTPLNKVVALKDILKSNSMVEHINRQLKYEYLFIQPIYDLNQLYRIMQKAVLDFNCIRPHGALNGLTPFEGQRLVCNNYARFCTPFALFCFKMSCFA